MEVQGLRQNHYHYILILIGEPWTLVVQQL